MADWSLLEWKVLLDCRCNLALSRSGRGRRIYIYIYIHMFIYMQHTCICILGLGGQGQVCITISITFMSHACQYTPSYIPCIVLLLACFMLLSVLVSFLVLPMPLCCCNSGACINYYWMRLDPIGPWSDDGH